MIKLYQTSILETPLGVVFWGSYTIHDDQSHGTRIASSRRTGANELDSTWKFCHRRVWTSPPSLQK